MDLRLIRADGVPAAELAAISRGALDRAIGDAELLVAIPGDEATVAGAFDRGAIHRGSGGAPVRVGPGSVWMQLALSRADALTPCEPDKLLNRYVRPLLKALTKRGAVAHYFGRDWVSVAHRPAALVAFAHDAGTGRALVEAIVAVTTPFAEAGRASFMGKEPATVGGDAKAVADAVVASYLAAYERTASEAPRPEGVADVADETPWAAKVDEAIGFVAAGRDRDGAMRVGGELMASRDAVRALEAALARGEDPSDAVDAAFGAPGVVTFGVRSATSIRDVIVAAG